MVLSRVRGAQARLHPLRGVGPQLSGFASVEALLAHARGREVLPVQPKVLLEGEVARVLLPGEPGY